MKYVIHCNNKINEYEWKWSIARVEPGQHLNHAFWLASLDTREEAEAYCAKYGIKVYAIVDGRLPGNQGQTIASAPGASRTVNIDATPQSFRLKPKPITIKRYKLEIWESGEWQPGDACMKESPNGDYVRYEDVKEYLP
jgi:hypothetical protein